MLAHSRCSRPFGGTDEHHALLPLRWRIKAFHLARIRNFCYPMLTSDEMIRPSVDEKAAALRTECLTWVNTAQPVLVRKLVISDALSRAQGDKPAEVAMMPKAIFAADFMPTLQTYLDRHVDPLHSILHQFLLTSHGEQRMFLDDEQIRTMAKFIVENTPMTEPIVID